MNQAKVKQREREVKPYYQEDRATIYCGDCIEVMAEMPENSVDAIVTDPPYGLEFMGKEWDRLWVNHPEGGKGRIHGLGGMDTWKGTPQYEAGYKAQLWHQRWATQALRVLKPGGYLLAFGGTRTYHRLVCGLEDAGFEIRDTILWLFGSGFPKNLDIAKQYEMELCERVEVKPKQFEWHYKDDSEKMRKELPYRHPMANEWAGWDTALKPAVEFICVARKPLSEKTVALNVLKWGTGGMDIDGARIATDKLKNRSVAASKSRGVALSCSVDGSLRKAFEYDGSQGRWPANVILECTCEEVIEGQAKPSGSVSGREPSKPAKNVYGEYGRHSFQAYDGKTIIHTDPDCPCRMLDEQSGESISKKAARGGTSPNPMSWGKARSNGDNIAGHSDSGGASRFYYCAKASSSERGKNNKHPTCKPVALMEYLIKLVSRKDSVLLDPFGGSMSTVLGAVALGRRIIAIEQSEEYCEMLKGRCRQMVMELCYA